MLGVYRGELNTGSSFTDLKATGQPCSTERKLGKEKARAGESCLQGTACFTQLQHADSRARSIRMLQVSGFAIGSSHCSSLSADVHMCRLHLCFETMPERSSLKAEAL